MLIDATTEYCNIKIQSIYIVKSHDFHTSTIYFFHVKITIRICL